MEILDPQETTKINKDYNGKLAESEFFEKILQVAVGGSLLIDYQEWPLETSPNTTILHYALRKTNNLHKFNIRRLQHGKKFLFIRRV